MNPNKQANKIKSKIGKWLLVGALPITVIAGVISSSEKAVKVEGVTTATAINTTLVNGVTVSLDQNLTDNSDGTYSLSLTTSSYLKYTDYSIKNTTAKYGYFKAKTSGTYVFEVWGGDGGSGEDTRYSEGGKGGEGAYLYSAMHMDEGDYIFYTIGGDGQQTLSSSTGGGANGDGGDHGDTGSYYVGGGGGFTAVYYFDSSAKQSFEQNYLKNGELTRTDVLESDRLTKYIMIAGGGGGGGAGNAFSISDKAVRTPDGGAAGGYSSPSGTLTGSTYKVNGTFFSGSNGYSSGKKQDYVGIGGSNVPGEVNTTFLEFFNGKQPNDWEGAANANYPGGSGGAGNLRGGAGGAGYAGGSGGIMTGLVIGTNVGGGGGGSSFIANSVRTSLSEEEKTFIDGNNTSTTGGAVYITYVPQKSDYECLEDLDMTGTISDYFDIVPSSVTTTHGNVSTSGNTITVTEMQNVPEIGGVAPVSTTVNLTIKPKDEFMGGNDVPVFNSDTISYQYVKDTTPHTFTIGMDDTTKYVNVPYKFELITNNYTGTCKGGQPYKEKTAKDLYVDNNYIGRTSEKGFDFIDSVTDYVVKNEGGTVIAKDTELEVTASTTYTVSFSVSPKIGTKAIVGDRLSYHTFEESASITIIEEKVNSLNGNDMTYVKTLDYNPSTNKYTLSVHESTSGPDKTFPPKPDDVLNPYDTATSGSYTITKAGYYELNVWGGKGGKGGQGALAQHVGQEGGAGGYKQNYLYLDAGTTITYTVGSNGTGGAKAQGLAVASCGTGGIRTELYINGTKVLVAGGGGGGGGGAISHEHGPGYPCTEDGTGTDGTPAETTKTSEGQPAGTNYINTTYFTKNHEDYPYEPTYKYGQSSYTNSNGGAVYLHCLSTAGVKVDKYSNYGVNATFTNNFTLIGVSIDGATATISDTNPSVTNIQPYDKVENNIRYVDFTVTYTLIPNYANCDGGNDIQLLSALQLTQVDCDGISTNDKIDVVAVNESDYTNVLINPDLKDTLTLNTYDYEYIQGDPTGIETSTLADGSTTYTPSSTISIIPVSESLAQYGTTVYPTTTTEYDVRYGFRASNSAVKSVVGPTVTDLTIADVATITVYHEVTLNVEHMKIDAEKEYILGEDRYVFTPGKDYEATLTPEAGWDAPTSADLYIDGELHNEYRTINTTTGVVTIKIPGDILKEDTQISFSTSAVEKQYEIHYVVMKDALGLVTKDFVVTAMAGETGTDFSDKIDALIANYPASSAPAIDGYTFVIEYPDEVKPTTMPAAKLWINGSYIPNPHTLTVHYLAEDGTPLEEDYIDSESYFHKEYSLTSVSISGYAPSYVKFDSTSSEVRTDVNAANPQFSMPDYDLEVYIYYVTTSRKVVINYVCKDNITLPKTQEIIVGEVGDPYSVNTTAVSGYTADKTVVSGNITEDGEIITVTYSPITYTISFDSDEGTTFDDRTVFYGHDVGYTGTSYETATFEPLPTPVKVGYKFLGWYINNTKITEDYVYNLTSNFTLKAKYEKKSYTVTVRYHSNNNGDTDPFLDNVVLTGLYGDEYRLSHQAVTGYTAPAMTSGTYGAGNIVIDVTYTINYHDIIVHYVDESGATLQADEVTNNVKYNTSYEVESTFTDDRYIAISPTTYTGNMPDNNLELTFEYTLKVIPVTPENSEITLKPTTGTEFIFGNEDNTPIATVKVNGTTLTAGKDFEIVYPDPFDKDSAGEKTITIHFKGDYSGDLPVTYTVKAKQISDADLSITGVEDKTYTGSEITQSPTVKDGTTTLEINKDYTLSYKNNINKGEATVTVTFIGNYAATPKKDVNFNILAKTISSVEVTGIPSEVTYKGSQYTPIPTVKDNTTTLTKGVDYEVFYGDNTDAGEGTVTVRFINNYSATPDVTKTFTIKPLIFDKTKLNIEDIDDQTFTGGPIVPHPTVTYDGVPLEEGKDYIIVPDENTDIPTGKVTIEFINNYKGNDDEEKNFNIVPKVVTDPENQLNYNPSINPYPDQTYTGEVIKPKVEIKDGDYTLIEGKDYDIICDDINAGPADFIIRFKGNYQGTDYVPGNFTIKAKDITNSVTVEPISDVTYTGHPATPHAVVKDGDIILTEGVDYTISSTNTKVGPAIATITFINNYAATQEKQVPFHIVPKVVTESELEIEDIPPHIFDGNPYEPKPGITYNGVPLIEGEDFEYIYEDNTHAPGGNLIIKFKGNFEGSDDITIPLVINPKVVQDPKNTLDIVPDLDNYPDQKFTGDPIHPSPLIIKDGDRELKEGEDFIIHSDDKEIGDAEFIIEFINDYEGTEDIHVQYEIVPVEFEITIPEEEYTGDPIVPHPIIKDDDGELLKEGIDYIVTCEDTESGTGTATIHFIGKYEGNPDIEKTFKIVPKDSKDTTVTIEMKTVVQTGNPLEPEVIVKEGDELLIEDQDYIVIYSNNTNPGTGTAHVIFIGNYKNTDPKSASFVINSSILDNRKTKTSNATVSVELEDGFEPSISLVTIKQEKQENDQSALCGRFFITYGGYDIKLYRDGKEIQPSDIKEGTLITLRIAVPSEIVGRQIRLVHVHSDSDISVIVPGEKAGLGTYIIDEEGYIVTQVNKFSSFSLIYEAPCFAHWFLLAIAILDIIMLVALVILGKKPSKALGISSTAWLVVLTAISGIFAHCLFCYIMLGVNGLLLIINIIFFCLFKGKNNEEEPKVVYVNAPTAPVQPIETVQPVAAESKEVKEETEPQTEVSLKDSMAQAKSSVSAADIHKQTVADWLVETYCEDVNVNVRPCMTSTGLPLGDTHFMVLEGKKKCFMYVYEVENKVFFIIRSDDDTAKEVVSASHKFIPSTFPKTRDYAKWYTMIIDESYSSNEEVFNTLQFVISRLKGDVNATLNNGKQVQEVGLKESIDEAKGSTSGFKMTKAIIANWLAKEYGNKVIINTRENMTSTGLPLGDTHYMVFEGKKKCFCYVYDVEDRVFIIVRSNNDVAFEIRNLGHKFIPSTFPKTRDYAKWYTMIIDDSYKSKEDVFSSLKIVIDALNGDYIPNAQASVSEGIQEEANEADLSLKDSINEAKSAHTELSINKAIVAEWLSKTYGDKVIVNTRGNMTSTGLPLGDTHYTYIGEQKKCFCYVYDIDGKIFFIVRGNKDIANVIKGDCHKFIRSAFPKTRDYAEWYTMIIDGSYKHNEEVFEELGKVIDSYSGKIPSVTQAQEEPQKEDLSLKDSINEAKSHTTELSINKQVIGDYLINKYGDKVIVNIRGNMTSTGLPLGDTHYTYIGEQKKCFCYVYDIEGKVFCIVRSDDNVAKVISGNGHKFYRSAFPKTRDYAKWYTMIIDSSYKSNEEFFESLSYVIESLNGNGVAPYKKEVEEVPPVNDLSLKDSIQAAKKHVSALSVNKQSIADYLVKTYGEKVTVNVRGNMTSTGLPLGDTHYITIGEQKKCICYVYDIEGKVFCIVRSDDETAKEITSNGHKFFRSAFPKTRDYAKWYTMIIDGSYSSDEDFYETLKYVISKLTGEESGTLPPSNNNEGSNEADLSLKDSINEAKSAHTELSINKAIVAEWLSKTYGDKVIVNTRGNMTSTGLPLGDTHYTYIGEQKKCFCYVYDIEGKIFFIVRGNKDIANVIKGDGHKFIRSAFPKTRDYAEWYTMIIDGSYKYNEEVFEELGKVINSYSGKIPSVTPAQEEPQKEDLSLKDSIQTAKEHESILDVSKQSIADYLVKTYGDKVEVNVRESMTSTGLPLGDTHYTMVGDKRKCFCYVYDIEGKIFCIVRGNKEAADEIKTYNHKFIRSAFPKTRDYAEWYTMIIDSSYQSNDDVYKALDIVIKHL